MNRFDREQLVAEIVSRVDILEIVSEYVVLSRKGKDYWGICPFHQEDTPSFSVSPDKQFFYCFGCQTGGNVITFLRKKDNLSYSEALSILAEKAGVSLEFGPESPVRRQSRSEKQRFYRLNELTANYYHEQLLHSSEGDVGREYLAQRGINQDSIIKFRLGYAPQSWNVLLNYLTRQGFSPAELERNGLVAARSSGGYYDRFRHRLIFPISDHTGQVVGFGGRVIGKGNPKYLNSPENRFFDKGKILFGLHLARQSIQTQQQAVIVEGYVDVLMCHQHGINNVVASMGTALTASQIQLILRYAPEVILAYDTDAAGQVAALRASGLIRSLGGRVRIVARFEDKDPDEIIKKQGVDYFRNLVGQAQDYFTFKLQKLLLKANLRTAEEKIGFLAEFWEDFQQCDSELERQEYCEKLSVALQVPETFIREEFRKNLVKTRRGRRQLDKNTNTVHTKNGQLTYNISAWELAERNLLRLMLEDFKLFERVEKEYGLELFANSELRQIAEACRDVIASMGLEGSREGQGIVSLASLLEEFGNDSVRDLLLKIYLENSSFPVFNKLQKEKAVQDYIYTINQNRHRKELEKIQLELSRAGQAGDLQRSLALAKELEKIKAMMTRESFH
jgi:DNA primase